jgi:hypothetical protein
VRVEIQAPLIQRDLPRLSLKERGTIGGSKSGMVANDMKIKLVAIVISMMVLALMVTPVFAAQGQITEVNPSGVGTTLTNKDGDVIYPGQPGLDHRDSAAGQNGDTGATECPITNGC